MYTNINRYEALHAAAKSWVLQLHFGFRVVVYILCQVKWVVVWLNSADFV